MAETWFYYYVCEATNSITFCEFLNKLRRYIRKKKTAKKVMLIFDNHRAHHSNMAEEVIDDLDLDVMFLPPYSSPLNSIETLWAILKRNWKNRMLRVEPRINYNDTANLLKAECEVLGSCDFSALHRSNLESVISCLHGNVVWVHHTCTSKYIFPPSPYINITSFPALYIFPCTIHLIYYAGIHKVPQPLNTNYMG